jgi:hypothetical protein
MLLKKCLDSGSILLYSDSNTNKDFLKVTFGMKKALVNSNSNVILLVLALLRLLLNGRRPSFLGNP